MKRAGNRDSENNQLPKMENQRQSSRNEDTVRINAEVPKSVRKWLQVRAAKEERSMREIILDSLKLYRDQHVDDSE